MDFVWRVITLEIVNDIQFLLTKISLSNQIRIHISFSFVTEETWENSILYSTA